MPYRPEENSKGEFSTTLGLSIQLSQDLPLLNFPKDKTMREELRRKWPIVFRCSARIGDIYNRSVDKVVVIDLQYLDPPMIQTSKKRNEHCKPCDLLIDSMIMK
jgi:hypothetical protein